jgi:hypothetical protein
MIFLIDGNKHLFQLGQSVFIGIRQPTNMLIRIPLLNELYFFLILHPHFFITFSKPNFTANRATIFSMGTILRF